MTNPNDIPEYAAMSAIAACLCAQIEIDELPDVCSCGVQPGGAIALDFGECSGIAWVAPRLGYPTQNFPNISVLLTPRGTQNALQVEVGISRSLPLTDDGEPLDNAAWAACAQQQMQDLTCIRRAVLCCSGYEVVLGQWSPIDPQGGVYGISMLVTVNLDKDED